MANASRHQLIARKPHSESLVRSDLFPRFINDIQEKTGSVLQAAPVLVVPLIGAWREKRVNEISVRSMNLNAIILQLECSVGLESEPIFQIDDFCDT